jgi:hypothetical protein
VNISKKTLNFLKSHMKKSSKGIKSYKFTVILKNLFGYISLTLQQIIIFKFFKLFDSKLITDFIPFVKPKIEVAFKIHLSKDMNTF